MRLLHVIASMDPKAGGVCQAVRNMVVGLSRTGVQNQVVSLDAPDEVFLLSDPFTIHAIGPGKGTWCYSSRLIPWLVANMLRYDGIVIHGLWLYTSYAVRKAMEIYREQKQPDHAENCTPKLLVMPHGMLDPYFQLAAGRKLKRIRNWIYWNIIESKTINGADKILFTSEEECMLAKKTFSSYNPRKEIVIGMGVGEPPYRTDKLKEAFKNKCPEVNNSPYILFLGRIHEKKGLNMLIDAYEKVLQETESLAIGGISTNLPKLIIAGPGIESWYGMSISNKVLASSVLSKVVFFTGMLAGDVKWGAFYGCEAFILPSHQENFGIAVVEAMACGKPVLISDKVNIWREIRNADCGIVAKDTSHGTEGLLKSWLNLSKGRKSEMGENAYNQYKCHFSIESVAHHALETMI